MPVVTGTLKRYGLDALAASVQPELVFVGSRLAVSPSGEVFVPDPVPVTLSPAGTWTVTLASTEGLPKDAFYRLEARWFSGGRHMTAVLHERIYVPIDGGDIGDVAARDVVSALYIYTGPTEPQGVARPAYWLVTGTGLEPGVKLGDLYKLT